MEDPAQHVGQPTKLWVVEAAWVVTEEGEEPTIGNVAQTIADQWGLTTEEATDRVFESIRLAEVEVEVADHAYHLSLDPRVARRVAQRHRFWQTVHAIVGEDDWQAERFPQEALDEAWQRVTEESQR